MAASFPWENGVSLAGTTSVEIPKSGLVVEGLQRNVIASIVMTHGRVSSNYADPGHGISSCILRAVGHVSNINWELLDSVVKYHPSCIEMRRNSLGVSVGHHGLVRDVYLRLAESIVVAIRVNKSAVAVGLGSKITYGCGADGFVNAFPVRTALTREGLACAV